jgi:hypothetical protein
VNGVSAERDAYSLERVLVDLYKVLTHESSAAGNE